MNIKSLCTRTGVTERQVRYLIAEGFLPSPSGGRSNADYSEDHVAGIERYAKLRELGFPPAAIRLLLEAREGAPFPIASGLTLVVDPNLIGSPRDTAPIRAEFARLLEELFREAQTDAQVTPDDRPT